MLVGVGQPESGTAAARQDVAGTPCAIRSVVDVLLPSLLSENDGALLHLAAESYVGGSGSGARAVEPWTWGRGP
jgi:hypothetical protein